MLKWKDQPEVDGLLFDYLHFYGSYDQELMLLNSSLELTQL